MPTTTLPTYLPVYLFTTPCLAALQPFPHHLPTFYLPPPPHFPHPFAFPLHALPCTLLPAARALYRTRTFTHPTPPPPPFTYPHTHTPPHHTPRPTPTFVTPTTFPTPPHIACTAFFCFTFALPAARDIPTWYFVACVVLWLGPGWNQ